MRSVALSRRTPPTMTGEEWRIAEGFPSYQVSSLGRVWSDISGKILAQSYTKDGYRRVSPNSRTVPVHLLVARTFLGPKPDGMEARHLNGDREDNRSANLAWGTHSENCQDTIAHGRNYHASKTHCPQDHEYTPKNTITRSDRPGTRSCRACFNQHQRDRRAAGPTDKMPHGHSKYTAEGCRCDICRAARAAYRGRTRVGQAA